MDCAQCATQTNIGAAEALAKLQPNTCVLSISLPEAAQAAKGLSMAITDEKQGPIPKGKLWLWAKGRPAMLVLLTEVLRLITSVTELDNTAPCTSDTGEDKPPHSPGASGAAATVT